MQDAAPAHGWNFPMSRRRFRGCRKSGPVAGIRGRPPSPVRTDRSGRAGAPRLGGVPSLPTPMLATSGELPLGPGWAYEFKWDGVRALAEIGPRGRWRLYARSGAEITIAYPELSGLAACLVRVGVDDARLDGEIVLLGPDGRPAFTLLAERMHVRDPVRADQLAATIPVLFMVFDLLRLRTQDLTGAPYEHRRLLLEELAGAFAAADRWVVPPRFDDGPATQQAATDLALEGVVAKRLSSVYRPGVRSTDWIKVKNEHTGDYVVGGWRPGSRQLGALLVGAWRPDGRLDFRGRVGGGISNATERELLRRLGDLAVAESPFAGELPREDARGARYVRPVLVVEVRYGSITPDRRLRFPRLVRIRPDKPAVEAVDE
jgi:bifunctional non-homologous end joining protein LigD